MLGIYHDICLLLLLGSCWGQNSNGQLGNGWGNSTNVLSPPVSDIPGLLGVVQVTIYPSSCGNLCGFVCCFVCTPILAGVKWQRSHVRVNEQHRDQVLGHELEWSAWQRLRKWNERAFPPFDQHSYRVQVLSSRRKLHLWYPAELVGCLLGKQRKRSAWHWVHRKQRICADCEHDVPSFRHVCWVQPCVCDQLIDRWCTVLGCEQLRSTRRGKQRLRDTELTVSSCDCRSVAAYLWDVFNLCDHEWDGWSPMLGRKRLGWCG